jgi:hypothetical protein
LIAEHTTESRSLMSTTGTQKVGMKGIRGAALAILTAGIASAAFAGPAAAVGGAPDLFTISGSDGLTYFGTNCATTGPPLTDAALVWNEDTTAGTVEPQVTGDICLQAPSLGVQTQVILEYRNNNHVVVATRPGVIRTGTGGLNTFGVDRGGLVFNSASMNHTHVRLLSDRGTPGVLHDVGMAWQDL